MDPAELLRRFGREFARGAVLFRQGDPAGAMYLLHRGRVSVSTRTGAEEKVQATFVPGDFLGETSILAGTPRSSTATCVEDCTIITVDAATLEEMVRADPEIAVRMMRELAGRLEDAGRRIAGLLLHDPRARVVQHLLDVSSRAPGASVPAPPAELAMRLGVDESQVVDALRSLERSGLILPVADGWKVADAGRLRSYLDLLLVEGTSAGSP